MLYIMCYDEKVTSDEDDALKQNVIHKMLYTRCCQLYFRKPSKHNCIVMRLFEFPIIKLFLNKMFYWNI